MDNSLIVCLFLLLAYNSNTQTTTVFDTHTRPNNMVIHGNYLYFSEDMNGRKISKIDLRSNNPRVIDVAKKLAVPTSLLLNGNDLYVTEYLGGRVSKIDISKRKPINVEVIGGLDCPNALALEGNTLYIAEYKEDGRISKIDLSQENPTPVVVVGGVNYPNGLLLHNNNLFIIECGGNKISKIDLSLPFPVKEEVIGQLNTPSHGMVILGDDLYVSELNGGIISKINLSSPTPIAEEFISQLEGPGDLLLQGNDLYITETNANKISKYSLPEIEVINEFHVFPNPATDFINVENLRAPIAARIVNIKGQVIKDVSLSNKAKLDILDLMGGVYFIEIEGYKPLRFVKN